MRGHAVERAGPSGPARSHICDLTLNTHAELGLQPGDGIAGIHLHVSGDVPGLDADGFRAATEEEMVACPVSKASPRFRSRSPSTENPRHACAVLTNRGRC